MSKLTVQELYDKLGEMIEKGLGDHVVRVPYIPVVPGMGPRTSSAVSDVCAGFDWDSKRVFIETEKTLAQGDEQFLNLRKRFLSLNDTLYMIKRHTVIELTHQEKTMGKKQVNQEHRLKTIAMLIEQQTSKPDIT